MPTSPNSFQREQTKVELDIVRTRLKQTETALKDVTNMNEILNARHKLFEEQRVNDAHAKLTGSQSVNDEASPDKSVSPPQHTNQTLE